MLKSPEVDFIFSSTEFERQAIARAQSVSVGGDVVPFATAEDLILHKLFAGRPRDTDAELRSVHDRTTGEL